MGWGTTQAAALKVGAQGWWGTTVRVTIMECSRESLVPVVSGHR